MAVLALALLLSTAAPSASAAASESITVTGIRLGDARRQLEACLARKCPPLEDMAATLQYAEALFTAGKYDEASSVLQRSLGRNRDEASRFPVAVAGLYRALGRVSMHEGEAERARTAAYGAIRSLQAGLPKDDPQILGGTLEAAELHASLGQVHPAERLYNEVADKARTIGRPDIAAMADVRRGLLLYRQGQAAGRALLEKVAGLGDSKTRMQQLAAKILLARIDREQGKEGSTQALIGELAAFGLRRPTLVYSPPIAIPSAATMSGVAAVGGDGEGVANHRDGALDRMEGFDYWADVGFWITPDGHVQEAEILRAKGPQHWLKPVLTSVAGRVYAPARGTTGPTYRVERFSYTSIMQVTTGTRIASHSPQGRIESLDITPDAPPARN